jgi:hypothetical protein
LLFVWQPQLPEETIMCRNIRTLFNFEPPATEEEVRAASLQFVRKVTGFSKPSQQNEAAFLAAVADITAVTITLLSALQTSAPTKNRAEEAAKARARNEQRFPQESKS